MSYLLSAIQCKKAVWLHARTGLVRLACSVDVFCLTDEGTHLPVLMREGESWRSRCVW